MARHALILLAALAGCRGALTQVVVSVDNAGVDIPGQVDAIGLTVRDLDDGGKIYYSLGHENHNQPSDPQPLCGAGQSSGCIPLPLSITLYPGARGAGDTVEVQVTAYLGGQPRIDDLATFHFSNGATEQLRFFLYKGCLGTDCAASGQACDVDQCRTLSVDGGGGGDDGSAPSDLSGADLSSVDLPAGVDLASSDTALANTPWVAVNSAFPTGGVLALGVAASNNSVVYAATAGSGLYRSDDAGRTWSASLQPGQQVSTLAVDPVDAAHVFLGGTSLYESSASGASAVLLLSQQVNALLIDPTNNNLYVGTSGMGVWFKPVGGALVPTNTGLTNLTVSSLELDSNLYAGAGSGLFKKPPGATGSWSFLNGSPAGMSDHVVAQNLHFAVGAPSIVWTALDPPTSWTALIGSPNASYTGLRSDSAGNLYLTTRKGIYKTSGTSSSWRMASTGLSDLFVRSLAIDPINPEVLYAGTESGVIYKSTTGGE